MNKIQVSVICFFLSPLFLEAVTEEEKYWEKQAFKNVPKGLGVHVDMGYSSYLIELHSSEIDSAIDYDVLEGTLGLSYINAQWSLGIYGKFVLDEVQSNMYVVTTQAPLNNHARIDKDEFALYINYTLKETEETLWGLNSIYRYARLDASDAFNSFFNYVSYLKYQTDGLAFSLNYQRKVLEKGLFVTNLGVLYSRATVNMSESANGQFQDSFIEDSVNALGMKVSLAYKHEYSENLLFHIRTDAWRQNFDDLSVSSRVGDSLPKASLKEVSYTTYVGLAWRF